jgi:hypothetical protein
VRVPPERAFAAHGRVARDRNPSQVADITCSVAQRGDPRLVDPRHDEAMRAVKRALDESFLFLEVLGGGRSEQASRASVNYSMAAGISQLSETCLRRIGQWLDHPAIFRTTVHHKIQRLTANCELVNSFVDVVMEVLAPHAGAVSLNDQDLPVEPLPAEAV